MRKHIYSLDQLRFFAASLVFFHHFSLNLLPSRSDGYVTYFWESWLRWGSTGVSLFIVLSGFLFVAILGERKLVYHKFIANRLLRIFPLLIIVMLLLLTATRATWSPQDLLRFLLLQVNTGDPLTGWGNDVLPFGMIWTIAVEFQFYLIFPLLLAILRAKDGVASLIWMIVALCVLRFFLGLYKGPDIYYAAYHTLLSRLDQFLIGMLAAQFWLNRSVSRGQGVAFLVLGLSVLSLDVMNHRLNLYRVTAGLTVEGLAWAWVILGYAAIVTGTGRIAAMLAKAGNLTFSIYLLHMFFSMQIFGFAQKAGLGTGYHLLDVMLYAYIPTALLSIVTYMGIERPFLRLKMDYRLPTQS